MIPKGDVKKSGSFGWCPPQSGLPLPSCDQTTTFYVGIFFLLRIPDTETDLEVKFLPRFEGFCIEWKQKQNVVLFWPWVVVGPLTPHPNGPHHPKVTIFFDAAP